MNLKMFDNVIHKIDKSKSWINIKTKKLITREIKYRKYVTIGKRYSFDLNDYNYYIIMLDSSPVEMIYRNTRIDNYGRIKIFLGDIWNNTALCELTKDENINISLISSDNEGEIYQIDV